MSCCWLRFYYSAKASFWDASFLTSKIVRFLGVFFLRDWIEWISESIHVHPNHSKISPWWLRYISNLYQSKKPPMKLLLLVCIHPQFLQVSFSISSFKHTSYIKEDRFVFLLGIPYINCWMLWCMLWCAEHVRYVDPLHKMCRECPRVSWQSSGMTMLPLRSWLLDPRVTSGKVIDFSTFC